MLQRFTYDDAWYTSTDGDGYSLVVADVAAGKGAWSLAGGWQPSRELGGSPGEADVLRGSGEEFRAIVAAVIGGTLLSGGYGSILGAVFGALIFGMVQQGIVLTGVDADWFQVLLGALLLVAVLANHTMQARLLRPR